MSACPICAGLGGASGGAASDAAKKFDDLIQALGSSSSAASNLQGVLDKLTTAEAATAAAAKLAAQTGYKAADVRRAMAAQAKDAADAARALAAAQAKAAASAQKAGEDGAKMGMRAAEKAQSAQEKSAEKAVAQFLKNQKLQLDAKVKGAESAKKATAAAAAAEAAKTQEVSDALKGQGMAATQTAGALGTLQRVLGMLGPEGQAAAVAIGLVVLVATALIGTLVKVVSTAIEASQALQQLQTSAGAYFGKGAAAGAKFLGELDAIAAKLPYTAAKIRDMAGPLIDARLRGAQLARAIEAVAAATAIMGDKGGAAATSLIKQLAAGARLNQAVWISPEMLEQLSAAGISAEVLARELGVSEKRLQLSTVKASVLGDVLQRVLIKNGAGSLALIGQTWDSITGKIQEGLTAAFAGLGDLVQPFMKEVQYLASELFKGSVASKGMGGALRAVLEPAFKLATSAVRDLHYALLYAEIAILTAYISLRPMIAVVDKLGIAGTVLKGVLVALGIVVGIVAVLVTGLAVAMLLVAAPFIIAGVAIGLIIYGLYRLMAAAVEAQSSVTEAAAGIAASVVGALSGTASALANWPLEAAKAGLNFVMGLVQAITTGQGPVADAARALAASALSALKGAAGFDSHSPSRKAHKVGATVPQGVVGGFEEGADDVEAAGVGLAGAGMKGITKGGGGKSVTGRVINFINCTFGAGMSETVVRDMVSRILEAEAASGPEPEPST